MAPLMRRPTMSTAINSAITVSIMAIEARSCTVVGTAAQMMRIKSAGSSESAWRLRKNQASCWWMPASITDAELTISMPMSISASAVSSSERS